jgi:hypothetical protein
MFRGIYFVSASTGQGVDPAFRHAAELAYEFTGQVGSVARKMVPEDEVEAFDWKCICSQKCAGLARGLGDMSVD